MVINGKVTRDKVVLLMIDVIIYDGELANFETLQRRC